MEILPPTTRVGILPSSPVFKISKLRLTDPQVRISTLHAVKTTAARGYPPPCGTNLNYGRVVPWQTNRSGDHPFQVTEKTLWTRNRHRRAFRTVESLRTQTASGRPGAVKHFFFGGGGARGI